MVDSVLPILSELTGRVLSVDSLVGVFIEPECPVVTIECLKMEIPVTLQRSGVIREIWVSVGDFVSEGQQIGQFVPRDRD